MLEISLRTDIVGRISSALVRPPLWKILSRPLSVFILEVDGPSKILVRRRPRTAVLVLRCLIEKTVSDKPIDRGFDQKGYNWVDWNGTNQAAEEDFLKKKLMPTD